MSYLKLLFIFNFVIQASYAETNQVGGQGILSDLFPGNKNNNKQNSLIAPNFDASKVLEDKSYDSEKVKTFGSAPLQMPLGFEAAEMALHANRVESFFSEKTNKLVGGGRSEDYVKSYCEDFLSLMTRDPLQTYHQILASDARALESKKNDKGFNEFVGQYKYLNHISKSMVEEFSSSDCNAKPEVCLSDLGTDTNKQSKLLDTCNNNLKVNLLSEEEDLSLVAKEAFGVSETEALLEELKRENRFVGSNRNKVCASEQSCLFNQSEGYHTSCDTFNCSMVGSEFSKDSINQVGSIFLLNNGSFNLTGSEDFCSSCFKKAAKQLNPNSDFNPELVEKTFENKIAGKKGAKKLLSLAEIIETAHDTNVLQNRQQGRYGCEAELGAMLKNKCGSAVADRNFDIRLKEAKDFLKIDPSDAGQFIKNLSELTLPAPEANACQRSNYAIYKRNQWIGPTNVPAREGFKSILRELDKRPGLQALVEKNCDENSGDKESFVKAYSEALSKDIMRELSQALTPEVISSNGLQSAICSSEDEFLVIMGCNDSSKVSNKNANSYFSTFHGSYNSVLGVLKDHYRSSGDGGQERLAKITDTIERMVQRQIQITMELAGNYDPFVKINMESWDNFCQMNDEMNKNKKSSLADYIDSNPGQEQVENYRSSQCSKIVSQAKDDFCGEVNFEAGEDSPLPFSKEDISEVTAELVEDFDYKPIEVNSIKCKLKSLEANGKGRFNRSNVSSFDPKFSIGSSDLERAYALDYSVGENGQSDMPLDFNRFKKFNNCSGNFAEAQKSLYEARSYSKPFYTNIKSTEVVRLVEKLSSEAERRNQSADNRLNRMGIFTGTEDLSQEVFSATSSRGSDLLGSLEKGRVVASAKQSEDRLSNNVSDTPSVAFAKRTFTDTASSEAQPMETEQSYDGLFDYMEKPSNGFQVNVDDSGNFQAVNRAPASEVLKPVCDDKCLQEILNRKPNGYSDDEQEEIASQIGMNSPENSTEQMKRMLEDVLDGKLQKDELEQLREENEKLRSEMASIRESIEQKDKPTKVIDSNGDDRSQNILSPETNSALVFNPRNTQVNEFKTRTHYEDKKEQFAPDYQESSSPERVSLGDYSARRRDAAKVPLEQVKQYNADIDQSFLRTHTNSPVDENFVRSYVSHVSKEAGSIEHLIVFENGVPAKIRVPDPKKPGSYVEHPIAEGMVDEILGQVEKQEVQSYAVYNMVNFGESLQDFMSNLNSEASSITSLEALNNQLKGLNNLD
ncbi:MAG: hypothetical protein KC478_05910 [Bacteriovoracaceae bacterium]|nr:hypothetical protein [Bacteriovoracaceae bacterium]